MKPCFFCQSKENIRVIDIKVLETGKKHPICHNCYNQAAYLKGGLDTVFGNIIIEKGKILYSKKG